MDPSLELIKACIDKMKADTAISAMVGTRIYDRVPEKQGQSGNLDVISPYISLGNTSLFTEDVDCIDTVSVNILWNCWSWGINEAYSSAEVRKLGNLVRKCLNKAEINLSVNGFVSLQHTLTNYNRANDGITNQASLSFEALIDAN